MMTICASCNRLILPSEEARPLDKFSTSAGGITVHVHVQWCGRALPETSPASRPEPIREG